MSPESKFSIQMSPGKGEKLPPELPEKQPKKQEQKTVIMDHGQLTIEMVDDAIDGVYKLPKYQAPDYMNYSDANSSPKKSQHSQEEELKIHDGSMTSEISSSFKTDPSMRDYDFMIEPEIKFNLTYGGLGGQDTKHKDSVSIGDGLGVKGLIRFKGQTDLYDLSESSAREPRDIKDKSFGDSFTYRGGGALQIDDFDPEDDDR